MRHKTSTTRPRLFARSNISIRRISFIGNDGGGLAVTFLSLMVMLLILIVVVNAADYALFSFKRNMIGKAIDYSVCAAVQEIDRIKSEEGLSQGYDEASGNILVDGIYIDETSADNAFFSTFQINTGIQRDTVEEKVLAIIMNPTSSCIEYIIKKDAARMEGSITDPAQIEGIINAAILEYCNTSEPENDEQKIYVDGNPETNEFKKRPYYMVFIKNYEIDGLFRKRTATYVGLAGAKAQRKE